MCCPDAGKVLDVIVGWLGADIAAMKSHGGVCGYDEPALLIALFSALFRFVPIASVPPSVISVHSSYMWPSLSPYAPPACTDPLTVDQFEPFGPGPVDEPAYAGTLIVPEPPDMVPFAGVGSGCASL